MEIQHVFCNLVSKLWRDINFTAIEVPFIMKGRTGLVSHPAKWHRVVDIAPVEL
jgi:hypothetical protein